MAFPATVSPESGFRRTWTPFWPPGVEVKTDTAVGSEPGQISLDFLRKEYDAVYISIGAHTDKKVGIEGEDAEGVISAVEMLRR